MLTTKQRFRIVLAVNQMTIADFAEKVKRSSSTVRRYYGGEFVRENPYLDHKLEKMWDSAVTEIREHEVLKYK